jgi:hypothetical protein
VHDDVTLRRETLWGVIWSVDVDTGEPVSTVLSLREECFDYMSALVRVFVSSTRCRICPKREMNALDTGAGWHPAPI